MTSFRLVLVISVPFGVGDRFFPSASARGSSGGVSIADSSRCEAPLKKPPVSEWLVFFSGCCATLDFLLGTLCDIVSLENLTVIHSSFGSFCEGSNSTLSHPTRCVNTLLLILCENQPQPALLWLDFRFYRFLFSDELPRSVQIFIWYQRREWRHRKHPFRRTGKSQKSMSGHFREDHFPPSSRSDFVRCFELRPGHHHDSLERLACFFGDLDDDVVAPYLVGFREDDHRGYRLSEHCVLLSYLLRYC